MRCSTCFIMNLSKYLFFFFLDGPLSGLVYFVFALNLCFLVPDVILIKAFSVSRKNYRIDFFRGWIKVKKNCYITLDWAWTFLILYGYNFFGFRISNFFTITFRCCLYLEEEHLSQNELIRIGRCRIISTTKNFF